MNPTIPDPKLLQEAHEAALKVAALLERSDAPDRTTTDNAWHFALAITCKLTAYRLQQRDQIQPAK